MKKRTCTGCGLSYPLTAENFEEKINAKGKPYYSSLCKNCVELQKLAFRKSTHEKSPRLKMGVRVYNFGYGVWARSRIADAPEEVIGMNTSDLTDYLLQTFKDIYGYEWDGKEEVEIDHIFPLGKATCAAHERRLWHYTNLRLIRKADNRNKCAKTDYMIEM